MNRVRVTWTGLNGLPGLSTFYLPSASTDVSGISTFFNAIRSSFPPGLTWTIPNQGDTIESATGALTGGWTGTGGSTVTSNGLSGAFAAGVGVRVKWNTSTIFNGRRLRGSTFFTHVLGSQYSNAGILASGTVTTFQNAASALVVATPLIIWHRGPKGMGSGGNASVSSATVPPTVSWLRSRRD